MKIYDGRLTTLINVYKTFKSTGIYLLTSTESSYGFPMGSTDDLGYFLYSTIFSYLIGADILVGAGFLFKGLKILFLGFMATAFYFINSSLLSIGIIIGGLLRLNMPMYYLNHVYLAYFFGSFSIVLMLLAYKKQTFNYLLTMCFFSGLISSFSENIRSFSSMPFILFFIIILLGAKAWKTKYKMLGVMIFFLGWSIPYAHFTYEAERRNNFLKLHDLKLPYRKGHIFWHNIYTGFGFLNNKEGITWSDSSGYNTALKVKEDLVFGSSEYDSILRDEILRLSKERKYFVITTIFAKLGVVLYFFLIYFGWIGLAFSWFYPKPWYIELGFLAALGMSALPGVLTLPAVCYLMGFITCTILYAMYSAIWALDKGFLKQNKV